MLRGLTTHQYLLTAVEAAIVFIVPFGLDKFFAWIRDNLN
jgi:hypothetical protein